jgi:ubiquinol-cytochrome c reductase cytochrome c1 subunit
MLKNSLFAILLFLLGINSLAAKSEHINLEQVKWKFDGALGVFDHTSIQRGFQVYKEVCASCHSLKRISYRNLTEVGFSEAEAKAIAAEYSVTDGPDDSGEMFERPAILTDHFVAPYENENAARASNGGAYPPDLSLIVKSRPDGANYLYSLLKGYVKTPVGFKVSPGMSYNKYFPGHQIAMPKPLLYGHVEYMDGTEASVDQMSKDVVNFLQWTAEPEMEKRKKLGIKILLFLIVASFFFWSAKKNIWKRIK